MFKFLSCSLVFIDDLCVLSWLCRQSAGCDRFDWSLTELPHPALYADVLTSEFKNTFQLESVIVAKESFYTPLAIIRWFSGTTISCSWINSVNLINIYLPACFVHWFALTAAVTMMNSRTNIGFWKAIRSRFCHKRKPQTTGQLYSRN